VGKAKDLYFCCGEEGTVEKGSDSTSWVVVGAMITERQREWWECGGTWDGLLRAIPLNPAISSTQISVLLRKSCIFLRARYDKLI
jgi:hypothetical protein